MKQRVALTGRADIARIAFKQGAAQNVLKTPHMLTHGRLREAHAFGSERKTARLNHGDETAQQLGRQGTHYETL